MSEPTKLPEPVRIDPEDQIMYMYNWQHIRAYGAAEYARGVADSAAEIERLRDVLDEIGDHAPWGGTKDKHIAWMQNIAHAALGETK